MKTPEQVLSEWTADEINFDGGGPSKVYTRFQFIGLATVFSESSFYAVDTFGINHLDIDMFKQFQRARRWDVKITFPFLLRFESLLELVLYFVYKGYASGFDNFPLYWGRKNVDMYNTMISKMVDASQRWEVRMGQCAT